MSEAPQREIRCLDDASAVCTAAAEHFALACQAAIEARGRFCVALAGGSTPRQLHALLTRTPFRDRIEWTKIDFFWGDERSVPPDHPDSNYRMAYETLLAPLDIAPERIHRMRGEDPDLEAAAQAYEAEIGRVFGHSRPGPPPRFDLVLLGMGSDGHTASLFPETRALDERERWVAANLVPALESWRLTLTLPLLNRAARVIFLVTGREKAAALREVLEGEPSPSRYPSQAVALDSGRLLFLVDRAAARALSPNTTTSQARD